MPTPDVRRRAGMLPPRHTGVAWGQRPSRSLAGSLAALAVFAVAGLTGLTPARGQAAPETATPQRAGAGADAGGRKVDAADARQLHALVQRWIDDGGLPPQDPGPIVVRDAVGVAVTLRLRGLTVGFGEAMVEEAVRRRADPAEPVNLVTLTRAAAGRAFDEALDRLRQAAVQNRLEGFSPDDPSVPTLIDAAPELLVDVQIARKLEPVSLPPDADFERLFGRFAINYHGLTLLDRARPDAAFSVIWPGRSVAQNLGPSRQLIRLLSDLDRPITDAERVAKPDGPPLARFEVVHVVRPQADLGAHELVRGMQPLPPRGIGKATVRDVVDRAARHLAHRLTQQGFRGEYRPTTGGFDPSLAGPAEQALAAYAMLRHDDHRVARLGLSAELEFRIERVIRLVESLARRDDAVDRPAVNALLTLSFELDPLSLADDELADAAARRLIADAQALTAQGRDAGASPATRGLLAAALATRYDARRDAALARLALDLIDTLWADDTPPDAHAVPWLALAHTRLASIDEAGDDDLASRYAELATREGDLIDLYLQQQLVEPPRLGPPDVLGGFEFQRAAPGSPPNPDWRTAPLLSLLSHGLRHDAVVAGRDRLGWLLSADLAARFVAQLMVTPPGAYYHRSPEVSLGGIRLSLWDNRIAPGPHSMALIAGLDLLQTLEQLEADAAGLQ